MAHITEVVPNDTEIEAMTTPRKTAKRQRQCNISVK